MTRRSRLAKLEERRAPEAGEAHYFVVRIVRRALHGELITEKRIRYRITPGGLVRADEPAVHQDAP